MRLKFVWLVFLLNIFLYCTCSVVDIEHRRTYRQAKQQRQEDVLVSDEENQLDDGCSRTTEAERKACLERVRIFCKTNNQSAGTSEVCKTLQNKLTTINQTVTTESSTASVESTLETEEPPPPNEPFLVTQVTTGHLLSTAPLKQVTSDSVMRTTVRPNVTTVVNGLSTANPTQPVPKLNATHQSGQGDSLKYTTLRSGNGSFGKEVKKPRKAQKQDLQKLNDKLNERGRKRASKEPMASPTVDGISIYRRQNAKAKIQVTELDVNDPASYFNGDVDLTEYQLTALQEDAEENHQEEESRHKRKVGKPPAFHLWDTFPIPYQFSASVPTATRKIIEQAIKLWEDNTCVRFQKDGPGEDKIEFVNGDGCSSFVGKAGGVQEVALLTPGCNRVGIASHEIGHSLGFFHEQSRPDQTENVKINYPNIQLVRYNNFMPMKVKDVNYYGLPYDYGSVMHYDGLTKGFTLSTSEYSILTLDPAYQHTIGQRVGPSFIDFKQVNSAYCRAKCTKKLGCQNNGYENPNKCDECKCPTGFGGLLCESVQPSSFNCGDVLLAKQYKQTFQTPNYPNPYSASQECNWLIIAPPNGVVKLEFYNNFSFPCNETCSENYVEIKTDGDFQRTGSRFCCDAVPKKQPFVSKSEKMIVMFRSSEMDGGFIGMQARYWSEGGGNGSGQTKPSSQGPLTTTTASVDIEEPGRTTPTNPAGCQCDNWGSWDSCSQACGGCGFIKRKRKCNRADCYGLEKRHCNFDKCPTGTSFIWNNGEFHLLAFGCCFGLLTNSNGKCTGLASVWNEFVRQASSGSI